MKEMDTEKLNALIDENKRLKKKLKQRSSRKIIFSFSMTLFSIFATLFLFQFYQDIFLIDYTIAVMMLCASCLGLILSLFSKD